MTTNRILQHVRSLIRRGGGGGVTDGQLLERFLKERDEPAFEVLVWRHGPMVLGLGQRVLGNAHDAEDVLQATFLTLVRKGSSIGKSASLASWLYKVAYRIALRARARAAKTKVENQLVEEVPAIERADDLTWRELRPLLDSAIERLPEKYRTAVVLCDLQGKSHREAAEQLGCAVGTISTRVLRARQLLRKRLAHHSLSVSVAALGVVLAQRTASALPAALTATTVRAAVRLVSEDGATGIISAQIAELIEGANETMFIHRFKIALLLVLAAGTAAVGAGLMTRREPPTPAGDPPRSEAQAKAPADKPAGAVTVRGRVLDPDGKPVQGVRLYWPRVPKAEPKSEDDIEIPQCSQTDGEGRFQFELPRADIKPEWNLALLAAADGYGVAWAEWPAIEKGGELTLRLVKDQPIEGRIISSEGKPVAGVRVSIATLGATREGKVDAFVTAWKRDWNLGMQQISEHMYLPLNKTLTPAKSDANGYFRVSGAGAERLVVLQLRGSGIAQEVLYVVNRAGFDAAAVNKAVIDRIPTALRRPGNPPLLYGPKLTYVTPASRRLEGTVREAGSGKPVAGYKIHVGVGYGFGITAVSDKEGHYQLKGVPKVKQYLLNVEPPTGTSWLRSGARRNDTEGVQPLTIDLSVARGIVLSGRVIDKKTGKGVKGGVRFAPLPDNKFAGKPGYDSYNFERLTTPLDRDGRFKMTVIPGPGVLMAQAYSNDKVNGQAVNPYKQATFDAKDREHVQVTENGEDRYFTSFGNHLEFLHEHALKVLDLAPDAGTAECNLFVQRGQTLTVKIEDADGKPLTGTTVSGLTDGWAIPMPIKDATCTVFALDVKKPRRLLFYHAGRKLAGALTVRGDEKEPPVARLHPTGAVIGRLLGGDGQPIPGVDVSLSAPDNDARELYRQLDPRRKILHTDKDGRFRIEGIVPEVKFSLSIMQARTFLVGEPRIGARQVKPGETLDLGDVRVKPGP